MKKKILVFSLILALFISGFVFSGTLSTNEKVFALNDNKQFVVVIGNGKIETAPDNVKINFGIKLRADSIKEGQEKISQIYDNITTKIKEFDASSTAFVNYSSSYPVCEHGIQSYEFNYDISVKSNTLENVNQIITIASENGATSFYNTVYTLENQEQIYNDALIKAKENAIEKANSLYSNTNLKELIEMSIFSYSEGSKDGKIIVEARVKARFELNNDTVENDNTNNDTSNENTTNDNLINEDNTNTNDNFIDNPDYNIDTPTDEDIYNNDTTLNNDDYTNNQDNSSLTEEQSTFEDTKKDKLFGLSF